jgi:hypothetical protein
VLEEEVNAVEELCTEPVVELPVFPPLPMHPRENTKIPTTSRERRIFPRTIKFTIGVEEVKVKSLWVRLV